MIYKTKRRINFFDCDPAGIMFFGNAFQLIHSAYEEMIASFGLNNYWTSNDFFVPIIKTDTQFLIPVKAGEEISIEVTVSRLQKHSFELQYICRGSGGEELFNSRTVHVFTDREFNKILIPADIAAKLKEYSEFS